MPYITYVDRKFNAKSLEVIDQANVIIKEYLADGYVLTLRQLYYQFVSRDLIANNQRQYKRLGSIINDARLAGCIDWNAIEDRTRNLEALQTWDDPEEILKAVANSFRFDKWEDQSWRVEVWIEKEALSGVFEGVCNELQVSYLSCKGYSSQSVMWRAAHRLKRYERGGQRTCILYFGDHDPSGMDMGRDIQSRLNLFGSDVELRRVALNRDQVDVYGPPPNPAKLTDSRVEDYIRKYGDDSWELDALEPKVLSALVRTHVEEILDGDEWLESLEREDEVKVGLESLATHWEEAIEHVKDLDSGN